MTCTVGDVSDKVEILALLASEQVVNGVDKHFDDINVLPLIEATNVVSFCNLAIMEDGVNGPCMVFHIEPVTHILSLAIDRQRLAMTDIVDEKRNQLFGELIWAIVVRAVGHNGGQSVCVVESANKVV